VVCAAGNDATDQPMFPAALTIARNQPRTPPVSVGALNPNGTRCIFSNEGDWVTYWERGSAIVSTFPTCFQGSQSAAVRLPGSTQPDRAAVDPDDFSGGFGRWSGTSFAAPLRASYLAQALIASGDRSRRPGALREVTPAAAARRAASGLKARRA
jgi:serine protease